MADYAQIIDEKANMIIINSEVIADELRGKGLTIIDVTSVVPKPSTGWTYDGNNFLAPIYKWAKIVSNAVDSILDLNETEASALIAGGDNLICLEGHVNKNDIEAGWGYVDGVFSAP